MKWLICLCIAWLSLSVMASDPIVGNCDPDFEPIVGDCIYSINDVDPMTTTIEARLNENASKTLSPTQTHDIAIEIVNGWRKYKVRPSIVLAMIETESRFQPKVKERRTGATGLMQIIPKYAKSVMIDAGITGDPKKVLLDPVVNVRVGILMLQHFKEYSNDVSKNHSRALAHYCGDKRHKTPPYVILVHKRAVKYQSCDIG